MHRPLCCYGRSALAALLFPVAEIAGVSDLGGVELAVLVLGGDGAREPTKTANDLKTNLFRKLEKYKEIIK